ncbi:MAG: glycosyltransferase family A protein [Ekhidna sp.]
MRMEGNQTPVVSVILPFYNAPGLEQAIKSILNQTFWSFELILIDNASTDASSEVAKKYADEYPHVRMITEPNKGVVFAANRGISEAKGEYVMRMDADDTSFPERMQLQVAYLEKHSEVAGVSGLVEYVGYNVNKGFRLYVDWLNSIDTPEKIYLNQFVEFPVANPTLMFRKAVFDEVGLFHDGAFPEDYEFFLRVMQHQLKISKVSVPVLRWFDSEHRLTRSDERYSQEAFFRVKAKYLATWLSNHNPFHPHVYLWAGGRVSRKRGSYLIDQGIRIRKYIDVVQRKDSIHFQDTPEPSVGFIVSYVANRGARDEIRTFLEQKGFVEGENFIIAS